MVTNILKNLPELTKNSSKAFKIYFCNETFKD